MQGIQFGVCLLESVFVFATIERTWAPLGIYISMIHMLYRTSMVLGKCSDFTC